MEQYALNSIYIKDYDEKTFKQIIKAHKEEEFSLKMFKMFNKKSYKKYLASNYAPIANDYQLGIVSNALKFANIDYDEFLRCTLKDKSVQRMNSQNETDAFWCDNIQEKWLCKNIDLQLRDYAVIYNEFPIFTEKTPDSLSICDYGCGSAALSMALNNKYKFKEMDLYDVDNYVAKYVQYAIRENNFVNTKWYDIINEEINKQYDIVMSLDVLEHIENSYAMLKKLTQKTKKSGYLILKIAFECNDPTHLPQAAKNFFVENDGIKFLKENFKQIKRFSSNNIINGIYKKM